MIDLEHGEAPATIDATPAGDWAFEVPSIDPGRILSELYWVLGLILNNHTVPRSELRRLRRETRTYLDEGGGNE